MIRRVCLLVGSSVRLLVRYDRCDFTESTNPLLIFIKISTVVQHLRQMSVLTFGNSG